MENKTVGNIIYKNYVNIPYASAIIVSFFLIDRNHQLINNVDNSTPDKIKQLLLCMDISTKVLTRSALVYYALTHKNPQVLKQPIMYAYLCNNILSSAYEMYKNKDQPLNVILLGVNSIAKLYLNYANLSTTCDLIEKFTTNQVKIPVGNTDIQVTGGATSIGVQWSSTDDLTDANLTGNIDESGSTT